MVKNVCHECISASGGCCVDVRLYMLNKEISPFIKAKKLGDMPPGHSITKWGVDGPLWVYDSGKGRCMFLDENNNCISYSSRPSICRLFPVKWHYTKQNEVGIYIDLLCPVAHVVPLKEIYTWAQEPRNRRYIEAVGPQDFDRKDKEFVNITGQIHKDKVIKRLYSDL